MRVLGVDPESIAEAGEVLRLGGLVIIPTETVYGLAASIESDSALAKIFAVKGRPADNPLIVHIARLEELTDLAEAVTPIAKKLAERFWPGPMTLVLEKQGHVSDRVTAGGSTVAIRMPSHPIARSLIAAAGVPLAAPSANRFMSLSPTSVDQIDPRIAEQVDLIVDGGPCAVGIESTVVDCTGSAARILRPGTITLEEISRVVPCFGHNQGEHQRRSPGQYRRHYSPKTRVRIANRLEPDEIGITLEAPANPSQIELPRDAMAYASQLYFTLNALDKLGAGEIVVQAPPKTSEWLGVWDRLQKAAYQPD